MQNYNFHPTFTQKRKINSHNLDFSLKCYESHPILTDDYRKHTDNYEILFSLLAHVERRLLVSHVFCISKRMRLRRLSSSVQYW